MKRPPKNQLAPRVFAPLRCSLRALRLHVFNPRAQLATVTLLAVLQKSPAVIRVLSAAKHSIEPATRILQRITIAASALGSHHALSGATTAEYSTTTSLPVTLEVGESFQMFFSVSNTMEAADSWSVSGDVPPGLIISGQNNEPLSAQNVFNANRGKVSGSPTTAGAYTFSLKPWNDLNATGETAEALEVTITVLASNAAPTLDSTIPNQSAEATRTYSYDVAEHFSDPDEGDSLTFSATLSDDSPLPSWLEIDTGTLSGTPPVEVVGNSFDIRATASDGELSVSDTFELSIVEPRVAVAPPATISVEDDTFVVTWQIQNDQVYTLESADTPFANANWSPLDVPITTTGDQQSAALPTSEVSQRLFLRVATDVD